MTVEEIERILKSVAESQKSIAENQSQADKEIVTLLKSQNRYEAMLQRHDEIWHLLADKQFKNEELFAELATWQIGHQKKLDRLEAICEMLGDFTNNTRKDMDELFAQTDNRLAALADFEVRTQASVKALNQAQTRTEDKLGKLSEAQARTEASLVKLSEAQTRTDEQIRRFLSKNGA